MLNQLQSWSPNSSEERIFALPTGFEDSFIQFVRRLKFPERCINEESMSKKSRTIPDKQLSVESDGMVQSIELVTDETFQHKIGSSTEILDAGRTGNNVGTFSFNRTPYSGCLLGSRRYETGVHRLRIKYEYGSVFIGLLSLSIEPRDPIFFGLESSRFYYTPSAYGFDSDGYVTLNGQIVQKTWTTVQCNDIFEFLIDCQQRRLYMKNERTGDQRELYLDSDTAPLPWRLFVILPHSMWLGSRVSLV